MISAEEAYNKSWIVAEATSIFFEVIFNFCYGKCIPYCLLPHHNVDPKVANAPFKTTTVIQVSNCFPMAVKAGIDDKPPTVVPSGELVV